MNAPDLFKCASYGNELIDGMAISKENNRIRRDIGLLYRIEKVLRRVLYPRRTEMDSKKKKKKMVWRS